MKIFNFNFNRELIYKVNVGRQIRPIKDQLLLDVSRWRFDTRGILNTETNGGYNYQVESEHTTFLMNLFEKQARRFLNDFNIKWNTNQIWCYYSDNNFTKGDTWHNHINTSTIVGVLYLKTAPKCGLEYCNSSNIPRADCLDKDYDRENKIIKYMEVKDYDLLIFPNFLDHRPIPHPTETRISLNMELTCKESAEQIFNLI